MKTFYTYDTNENKLMVKVMMGIVIFAALAMLIFTIIAFTAGKGRLLMSVIIIGTSLLTILLLIPARKKYEARVKNESLVAHDWGIEYLNGELTREAKWEQIAGIDTVDRSWIILWHMKEYVISVAGENPIKFYSNLENSDFLVNYIKKNLKKRGDEVDVKWTNKQ